MRMSVFPVLALAVSLAASCVSAQQGAVSSSVVSAQPSVVSSARVSAAPSFDVASIRPSSGEVKFERDGEVTETGGTLRMRDVRVLTCIKWAYHVQRVQIVDQEGMGLDQQHYDITAKAPADTTDEQMRAMMRTLLAERFALKFHPGTKDVSAYVMTVSPSGLKKLKPAAQEGAPWHENSSMGMVAKNWSMKDFVTYISDPLGAPMVDETKLPGRYDFSIDFRPYVDQASEIHADPQSVLKMTLEGELGLKLTRRKATIDTMVIDHVTAPTEN